MGSRLLSPEMKASRGAFLKRIVSGDEASIHYYRVTKQQSSPSKSPSDSNPHQGQDREESWQDSSRCFFDSKGMLYHRYIPNGETINAHQHRYCSNFAGPERGNTWQAAIGFASARQRACTYRDSNPTVSPPQRHRNLAPSALFTRQGQLRFRSLPSA